MTNLQMQNLLYIIELQPLFLLRYLLMTSNTKKKTRKRFNSMKREMKNSNLALEQQSYF